MHGDVERLLEEMDSTYVGERLAEIGHRLLESPWFWIAAWVVSGLVGLGVVL